MNIWSRKMASRKVADQPSAGLAGAALGSIRLVCAVIGQLQSNLQPAITFHLHSQAKWDTGKISTKKLEILRSKIDCSL